MKGKALKKITVFLLALILAVPVFSWNNVRTVQAATVKTTALKSISAVKKGVKITWKKTSGASGYYVYRKTGNGKWKKIATLKKSSITSYTDKKVTSGNKYTYTVKGYKGKKVGGYNKSGLRLVYLSAPTSLKAKTNSKKAVLSWNHVAGANGYYIYRKDVSGNLSKIGSSQANTYTDSTVLSGNAYTYEVRAYKGKYLGLSASVSCKTSGKKVVYRTIQNTSSEYSIEADLTLTGTGSGYHAKMVICTPYAGFSFGIQHDEHAKAPYTGQTTFMTENVMSNDAGGQDYQWIGIGERNRTYHLMLTVNTDGTCKCFIDGVLRGTYRNPNLANQQLALRVEGSARKNGDSVNAVFSNIKLKNFGKYEDDKVWGTYDFTTNSGIKADASAFEASRKIVISGNITGLTPEQDWDNAYGIVSGTIQFVG